MKFRLMVRETRNVLKKTYDDLASASWRLHHHPKYTPEQLTIRALDDAGKLISENYGHYTLSGVAGTDRQAG
jgi:hypothetical protein